MAMASIQSFTTDMLSSRYTPGGIVEYLGTEYILYPRLEKQYNQHLKNNDFEPKDSQVVRQHFTEEFLCKKAREEFIQIANKVCFGIFLTFALFPLCLAASKSLIFLALGKPITHITFSTSLSYLAKSVAVAVSLIFALGSIIMYLSSNCKIAVKDMKIKIGPLTQAEYLIHSEIEDSIITELSKNLIFTPRTGVKIQPTNIETLADPKHRAYVKKYYKTHDLLTMLGVKVLNKQKKQSQPV